MAQAFDGVLFRIIVDHCKPGQIVVGNLDNVVGSDRDGKLISQPGSFVLEIMLIRLAT